MVHAARPTFTVVSCHFGDLFWIHQMATRINRLSDDRVQQLVIVDQSRSSQDELRLLDRVSEVLSFPVNEVQTELLGHDHPASLNRALRSIDFTTSHVLVMDSDCFPTNSDWLDKLSDVTLASDYRYGALSHPCLMAFPSRIATQLDFAEGIQSIGMDTGRLVAAQIARLDLPVHFSRPTPAFHGYRGHFLLEGSAYHHGSASFISSADGRLTGQVDPQREARFRELIQNDQFELTSRDLLDFKVQGAKRRIAHLAGRNQE